MSAENFPIIEGVDIADGLGRLRGNATLYKRLLLTLVNNTADELKRWETLPPESERANVGNCAHKLKGGAGNLSATELAAAAHNLEKNARDESVTFSDVLAAFPAYLAGCKKFHDTAKAALV